MSINSHIVLIKRRLIHLLIIIIILALSSCTYSNKLTKTQKSVAIESSEYLSQDRAMEYCSHFFDVNERGILLQKGKLFALPFTPMWKHKRFPFESTYFYIEPTVDGEGNIAWDHSVYIIISIKDVSVTQGLFSKFRQSGILNTWSKLIVLHDDAERNEEKTRKLATAFRALGVNIK